MHVKRVTLENVKSFRGTQIFNLHPGVNYFVGDNNSGKSTALEALLFLFQGPSASRWTPETFYCKTADGPTRVEAEICGDLDALVAQEKFKLLASFVFTDDDGDQILRLERSSESRSVIQSGKAKSVDVKTVCFWHPEREAFENVTGIDAKVKALFDFEAVWADAHPSEHIDFANTKTLGRLLDAAFKRFVDTETWKTLKAAHEAAFSSDAEESFSNESAKLARSIQDIVDDQYGPATYRFDFGLPDASVFMKQGTLHVDDGGGGETPVSGKGTGMQRAIALGIIQLYARAAASQSDSESAPLILMLDEPETWLHPSAQLTLAGAVSRIGENEQVFVVTHSPYLIRTFDPAKHALTVFSGKGDERTVKPATHFGVLGTGEPSWGEINFRAFEICSVDFHNELYGYVQRHVESLRSDGKSAREKEINLFLVSEGIGESKQWQRNANWQYPTTLPVYVRNSIHHPENQLNPQFTQTELRESTALLLSIVESLSAAPAPTE